MCKFCRNPDSPTFNVDVRSEYVDDNVCEYMVSNNCEDCSGCNNNFELSLECGWNMVVAYRQAINELRIHPFSEWIQINFCPFCGRQLVREDNFQSIDCQAFVEISEG